MLLHSSALMRGGQGLIERPAGSRVHQPSGREGEMAERVGFEPTDRVNGQRFSRPPHSTTLAPLRVWTSAILERSSLGKTSSLPLCPKS